MAQLHHHENPSHRFLQDYGSSDEKYGPFYQPGKFQGDDLGTSGWWQGGLQFL
jgi:hypothetical protein